MLIAVQKDQIIHAVLVDNRQACEMIARAIGHELDGKIFNIFDEVVNPQDAVLKSFQNLSPNQFFDARHDVIVTRDPMYLLEDTITYKPYNYILFNLDNQKIIVPDYYDYEDGFHLTEIGELSSTYEAYKHASGVLSNHNRLMQFAFAKKLILIKPTDEYHKINDSLVRTTYVFRENVKGSQPISISYCFCCETFECKCTPEQIEEYTSSELPF